MSEVKKAEVSVSDTLKKNNTKTKKDVMSKKGAFIYLGPDIKGVAYHCNVYSGEVDSFFRAKMDEVPILRELLVPIREGRKRLAELKNGGEISRKYQAAVELLKEE